VIGLSVGELRGRPLAQVVLLGKVRTMRVVPFLDKTVQLLRPHRHEHRLDRPAQWDHPVFQNAPAQRFSRSGLRYILQKYVGKARGKRPSLTPTVPPHTLRHTKGMHLLQSGISLEMLRDFLGHVDVKATQIYARSN